MTRIQRLLAWVRRAATLSDPQCERVLREAMRRAGWIAVTKIRIRKVPR